ncbi:MAG: hypothetical protein WC829_01590 [Hyphomicrobium sp.]|jgi:hypothetical protein
MNTIMSSMTDEELEVRLYAEPNTPGAVEELLARFRALQDEAEEQAPLLRALAFNNLDTPLDINNAVDDQAELQTLLADYGCPTSKELRELLDNK